MRRRASNDGCVHGVTSVLGMRASLVQSIMNSLPPTPRKPAPKPHSRPPGSGPDEMILEIRRLYEQCGMDRARIRQHMADLGFRLSRDRVLQITEYYTRSHLVPAANAAPYLSKENPCTTSTPSTD